MRKGTKMMLGGQMVTVLAEHDDMVMIEHLSGVKTVVGYDDLDQPTADQLRREMIESGQPVADLAADPDRKWTTAQLQEDFTVIGFAAPFVVVERKSDGAKGTLEFTHSPRAYFAWAPDQPAPAPARDTADHTRSDHLFFEPE